MVGINLSGIYPPIITPFEKGTGKISWSGLQKNFVEWNKMGFKGYVVGGSTGESVLLDIEEKLELLRKVKELAKKDSIIIAGLGLDSTEQTIEFCKKVAKDGIADVAMIITPYYFKGRMNDSAFKAHFIAVADKSPLPILLYNVPGNTNIDLSAEAIIDLSRHPNIIGIKDSSGDVTKTARIVYETKDNDFQVIAGSTSYLLPSLLMGAVGGICALVNVLGQDVCQLYELYEKENYKDAVKLQQKLIVANTLVTSKFGIAGVKAAMDRKGLYGGPCRLPMLPLCPGELSELEEAFNKEKFFFASEEVIFSCNKTHSPILQNLFIVVLILNLHTKFTHSQAKEYKCSGFCTEDVIGCRQKGGRIFQHCTDTRVCCEVSDSCGTIKSKVKTATFKSPGYPEVIGGDLNCDFKFQMDDDTIGLKIDFIDAQMDGQSYLQSPTEDGHCDSDMIYFKGFAWWTPPARCGNLTGYSVVVDTAAVQMKLLSVVALMSSPNYRWHIKMTQVSKHQLSPEVLSELGGFQTRRRRGIDANKKKVVGRQDEDEDEFDGENSASQTPGSSSQVSQNQQFAANPSHAEWRASFRIDKPAKKRDKGRLCSSNEGRHFCSGAVVSDRFVLSAAHCFFGSSKSDGMARLSSVKVMVGEDANKCDQNSGTTNTQASNGYYEIESVTLHYAYDQHLIAHDLALVKIKAPIRTARADRRFKSNLYRLAQRTEDFSGREAIVQYAGVQDKVSSEEQQSQSSAESEEDDGEPSSNTTPVALAPSTSARAKEFVIQNINFCTRHAAEHYADSETIVTRHPKYKDIFRSTICTLTKDSNTDFGTGKGDSGGPLIVTDASGRAVLVGVVSYAIAPEPTVFNRSVDYYSSVAHYRRWIEISMLE